MDAKCLRQYLEHNMYFINISFLMIAITIIIILIPAYLVKGLQRRNYQGEWPYITGKSKVEVENEMAALPTGRREYTVF